MRRPGRTHAFAGLVAVCAAGAALYLLVASRAPQVAPAATTHATPLVSSTREARRLLAAAGIAHARLVFRDLDRRNPSDWGRIATASLTAPGPRRLLGSERCERVYVEAGRGLCLAKSAGLGTLYKAEIMDARFRVVHSVAVGGIPSRARISPDGRYGATTTFVAGHSYNTPGKFSTQTLLIDLTRGKVITNLERFRVTLDGHRVDRPDVNFWGVTFARSSNRFYATMASGHKTYLIQGEIGSRTARVLHENVECPSLSPDGTRIAYKKLVAVTPGSPRIWHLHVLDLRTMHDTALAEPDAIDDQVEWLGNRLVVYAGGEEVRVVRADGTGRPVRLMAAADSPAVAS